MNRERGFTLIELMVALVVSSLLVGMILAIFSRMSLAYRGQQQIAGVQQVLAAARATIELDAKQAGLELPQGFKYAADPNAPSSTAPAPRSPVTVTDSSTGPDQLFFYYADPTMQSRVVANVATAANPAGGADIATYNACVLRIQSLTATSLTFEAASPWGRSDTSHCALATTLTMVYKFVAHAYRIDTTRPALGVLQQSPTGGLTGTAADAWTDLAFGFTDIQTALRIYTSTAGTDLDGDSDGFRDWYSGSGQATMTQSPTMPALPNNGPIQMSISLVARTDRDVEGIATTATPTLIKASVPNNNQIGNRASVSLPSTSDAALMGSRIYRYTTFQVDLRNLGVGR
jgi:prepilin-type N-terminal cleavage/methylation domain-containing protein